MSDTQFPLLHTTPMQCYNSHMRRGMKPKEKTDTPLKAPQMGYKARLAISEYADHMDLKKAAKVAGMTTQEMAQHMKVKEFRSAIERIDSRSSIAVGWNKTEVIANAAKLQKILMEQMESGETKVANAAVRMVELGLNSHGLGKKESSGSVPQINVNINLGDEKESSIKVIGSGEGND